MTRYAFTIHGEADRQRVMAAVRQAPTGTRVDLKAAKRSMPQNDRMWAMLTDIAMQKEHNGRKYPPDVWKALFLNGWQRDMRLVPSLDGSTLVPLTRTSDLSKQEFSELIEFMFSWGAENGVTFHDDKAEAA